MLERLKLASSGPALWLHWARLDSKNPLNFIAGLFPATVASLSFVNYGGKFRLEWMSTSEIAECFYPSDSFLRLDMLDVQTPVKPAS